MEMRAVWQRLYRQHDAEVQLSLLSALCLSRCFLLSFPLLLSRCLLVHPSLLLFSHIRLRVWLIFMFLSFWCNMIYSFRFGFSFSSYFLASICFLSVSFTLFSNLFPSIYFFDSNHTLSASLFSHSSFAPPFVAPVSGSMRVTPATPAKPPSLTLIPSYPRSPALRHP